MHHLNETEVPCKYAKKKPWKKHLLNEFPPVIQTKPSVIRAHARQTSLASITKPFSLKKNQADVQRNQICT